MADYYEVLGVSRNASQDDIKKAYKRLVRANHPDVAEDKAKAEKLMGTINEAYGVLNDPDKRSYYDQFGTAPGQNGGMGGGPDMGGFGGFPFGDIFETFFGGGGRGSSSRGPRPTRGRDVHLVESITLQEAFAGVKREVHYEVEELCLTCQGKLTTEPDGVEECHKCKGTGQIDRRLNIGFGTVLQTVACPECRGQGKKITKPCPECHGRGVVHTEKHLEVEIPAGIEDGMTIRAQDQGEPGKLGGHHGDLLVTINVQEMEGFQRERDDLVAWRKLTFTQAALGAEVEIDLIDGTTARLKIPAGTQSGERFTLKGKGMPHMRSSGAGNMYVHVLVVVPTKLNAKQKQLLQEYAQAGSEEAEEKSNGWFNKLKDAIFG